jgi:NAD+ kinase
MEFRRIGIISKPRADAVCAVVPELVRWLGERGREARFDLETAECLGNASQGVERVELVRSSDLLIVLGGDGTLLALARIIGDAGPPILPVNLGGLGFLTSVTLNELYPILEEMIRAQHRVSERIMLEAQVMRGGQCVQRNVALNDAVVNKSALARIIDLDLHIDGGYVCSYKADGLIISTPTGSTAYSLAAGGPIVYPILDAFVVTPICPHALTNRPLVIPDRMQLEVQVRAGEEGVFLTLDGQVGFPLNIGDSVRLVKSNQKMRLVRPSRRTYFGILRDKLKWGAR